MAGTIRETGSRWAPIFHRKYLFGERKRWDLLRRWDKKEI